ncbi:MAG: acetate--CoA ligase family protein [Proteobacteria bacterium]|nr:acetate--CoA ligase family protein [Pseudomonadota bacterium]
MKIHEYQAKELFRKVGIPVPDGQVCHKREEIPSLVATLNLPVAIKAQILAGGRGKGGGVALAKTAEEAQAVAERILGMRLVTLQTGDQGTEVRTILFVSETCPVSMVKAISKARSLADQQTPLPIIIAPQEKLSKNHLAMARMFTGEMFFIDE